MSRARGIVYVFVLCAFLLLAGEGGARIWRDNQGDPLDRVLPLLAADAALGWRQRSHLDASFYGTRVRTNAQGFRAPEITEFQAADFPVLVLGPSSAFGWGVEAAETYSAFLAESLQAQTRQRVAVFNAGQIGFSSWQGRALARAEFAQARPRLVLLAYGVNDLDHFRFFFPSGRSDAEELGDARASGPLQIANALGRSAALVLARRATVSTLARFACAPEEPPRLRVPPAEFAANITELARSFRERGAVVALMTTPFALDMVATPAGAAGESDEYYRQSAAAAKRGDCAASRELFAKARALEPGRVRAAVADLNRRVRALGESLELPVIDAESLLRENKGYFVDPVHPSATGHRLIAAEIARLARAKRWLE